MSNIRIRFDGEDGEVWVDPDMLGGWGVAPDIPQGGTVLFTHALDRIAVVKHTPAEVGRALAEAWQAAAPAVVGQGKPV